MATRFKDSELPPILDDDGDVVFRHDGNYTEHEKDVMTRKALADVDAGRVVEHHRVVEWMVSLGTDNPLPMPEPLPG